MEEVFSSVFHSFIESKSFEFVVEEGGSFFLLHIYERGRISLRSICMGKKSAMRILNHIEDLVSKQSPGRFARTVREGDSFYFATGVQRPWFLFDAI